MANGYGGKSLEDIYNNYNIKGISEAMLQDALKAMTVYGDMIVEGSIEAKHLKAQTLEGITVLSNDGEGNTVEIANGKVKAKIDGRDMVKLSDYKAYFYDSGTKDPTPDYSIVGTLGTMWDNANLESRGVGIVGFKDFIGFNKEEADGTQSPFIWLDLLNNRINTYEKLYARKGLQVNTSADYYTNINMHQYNITNAVAIESGRFRIQTDRPWDFLQGDSGATASLLLKSTVGEKNFYVVGSNNDPALGVKTGSSSSGKVEVYGDFEVWGTKSAKVETESYGNRLMYAVESPDNRFQDLIEAILDVGTHWLYLNPMFAETINGYSIIGTAQDGGSFKILAKEIDRFQVKVTGGTEVEVAFLVYGKRKGFEDEYMKEIEPEKKVELLESSK